MAIRGKIYNNQSQYFTVNHFADEKGRRDIVAHGNFGSMQAMYFKILAHTYPGWRGMNYICLVCFCPVTLDKDITKRLLTGKGTAELGRILLPPQIAEYLSPFLSSFPRVISYCDYYPDRRDELQLAKLVTDGQIKIL